MDGTHRTFVIIGGGLAGASAAAALREEGFSGRVILIGDEHEQPYERPPLSKGYLTGDTPRESVYVYDPAWYASNRVELHLGQPAVRVDRATREVWLGDGTRLVYDALLLATGAEPRRLGVPGTDLAGVHHLRRLSHADHLRGMLADRARPTGPLVIAGAGWIGLEVAAAARAAGIEVLVVESAAAPLHAVLGPELGGLFADLHAEHGVRFRFGSRITEITGDRGMVAGIRTDDGQEFPARAVLAAIGAAPRTSLAAAAGLELAPGDTGGGVTVGPGLATSDPRIFAAGDVAALPVPAEINADGAVRHRVDHWANARHSGAAAARAMLGRPVTYDRVPYFFSDQYDVGLEYSGWSPPGAYDQLVCRGDIAKRSFVAFLLRRGRVRAGLAVNVWDTMGPVQRLIRSGTQVDPLLLADPEYELADLLG